MRLLHARLPHARRQRAGAPARHRRRGAARRALVQPLPLHRLPEHHHGGARRAPPRCAAPERPREPAIFRPRRARRSGRCSVIRSRASRTGRWSPATGATPATSRFRISCTCAWCASSHAHARILSIDTAAARAHPGVVAVWTADDIADVPPIDFRDPSAEVLKPYPPAGAGARPRALCRRSDRGGVRRGPVCGRGCGRAGRGRGRAAAGADRRAASSASSTPAASSEPTIVRHSFGDIDAAFAQGACRRRARPDRPAATPACRWRRAARSAATTRRATCSSCTAPPRCRTAIKETLVRMLKRSPHGIHLFEGHIGGGFGIRGELYPEDVLVLLAAMRLGRPVKWIEDRREHLICANHSRHQHHRVRAAVDADGRLLGIEDEFFHDQGAYVRTHGARVVGPHHEHADRPATRSAPIGRSAHFRLTNKTPAATYRAPGRYEGTFVRERLMDAIADRLGIDRIELRRRNLIPGSEMPFTVAFDEPGAEELILDSGDYPALLDKALAHFEWDEVLRRGEAPARRRRGGRHRHRAVRRGERARAGGRREDLGRYRRHGRGRHRRRLGRPGLRHRDGADLRRAARRRLQPHPRGARPHRPHRLRHRRACGARHRDDRRRRQRDRARAARQGAASTPPSCCRRRPRCSTSSTAWCAARTPAARRSRSPTSPSASAPAPNSCTAASRGLSARGLVPHRPHGLSLRRAVRRGAGRPRHRPGRRSSG